MLHMQACHRGMSHEHACILIIGEGHLIHKGVMAAWANASALALSTQSICN